MADVDLTELLDEKKREFGTMNQASGRFNDDFVAATNRAINKINREADLSTQITRISSPIGTIANLDEKYQDVISVGVHFELLIGGRRPPKGADRAIRSIKEVFYEEIQSMATDIRNIATYADSDDESVTNIGLGPLG